MVSLVVNYTANKTLFIGFAREALGMKQKEKKYVISFQIDI